MNSLKSACSFAKSTPVPFQQFQQDVEPLLGRSLGVELIVGAIGILKAAECLNDSLHGPTLARRFV